jgi:hypothetical protein
MPSQCVKCIGILLRLQNTLHYEGIGCLLILIESSVFFYHNIVSYLSTSLLFSICYEIIINRGLLIFVDFSVHLNHEN